MATQAVAQAKQQQGANPQTIDQQMQSIQQLGQQLQAAIKQLTKQQQKTQGATGGAGGGAAPAAQPPAAIRSTAWAPAGSSWSRDPSYNSALNQGR